MVVAFGRMLIGGGSPVLTAATVAEMTRNQLPAICSDLVAAARLG